MRTSKEVINLISNMRKNKKISMDFLAEKVGISKSTLSRYENEQREFPINDLGKYANALGTSVEYLLGVENLQPASSDFVKVPILGEIACGDPIYAQENFAGYRAEPKDSLPSGNTYYLRARGDSMTPTIPQGAYVLIREQPDVENSEIAAVLLNGDTEATLKRIRKTDNAIMLIPDNSSHEPIITDKNNPCKIIGKAIRYTFDL